MSIEDKIIELYKECLSPDEICETLGVKKYLYNRVIKENGLADKKMEFKIAFLEENHGDEIVELYANKTALHRIAGVYKTDKNVIKEILLSRGIELRVSSKGKDLTGQRSSYLVAIEKTSLKDTKGSIKYLCRCDCGNEKLISANDFRQTKSCGCGIARELKEKDREKATLKYTWWDYKKSARRRDYDFSLELEDFIELIKKNCYYCGQPPSIPEKDKAISSDYETLRNGIDRKQNDIGYTLENCVPCCTECNMIKGSVDYDVFLEWVARVSSYMSNKENY